MDNRAWSDRIIRRFDPTFRHRWEVYNDLICSYMAPHTIWIDVGCGDNSWIRDFGERAGYGVGIDIKLPVETDAPFVCGKMGALPIRTGSVDLLTLRFVVEHLENIERDFAEVERVLNPGGRAVLLTTNSQSPLIALPRLFPFRLKNWFLRTLYKVDESDILPTFHRFNSLSAMKRGVGRLRLERYEALQDANFVRRWIFVPFFVWHLLTRPKALHVLRTNILAVLAKPNHVQISQSATI